MYWKFENFEIPNTFVIASVETSDYPIQFLLILNAVLVCPVLNYLQKIGILFRLKTMRIHHLNHYVKNDIIRENVPET